ncbi:hypothetical protein D3C75_623000 [compost metagenome]
MNDFLVKDTYIYSDRMIIHYLGNRFFFPSESIPKFKSPKHNIVCFLPLDLDLILNIQLES